jgi:hypothetical protein
VSKSKSFATHSVDSFYSESESLFDRAHLTQFAQHIRAYADVLYSWELFSRRADLLKMLFIAGGPPLTDRSSVEQHDLGKTVGYTIEESSLITNRSRSFKRLRYEGI